MFNNLFNAEGTKKYDSNQEAVRDLKNLLDGQRVEICGRIAEVQRCNGMSVIRLIQHTPEDQLPTKATLDRRFEKVHMARHTALAYVTK